MDRRVLLLVTIIVEGGLFLLGLVLINYSQIALLSSIHFSWIATAYALLLCIPMFAVLYIVMNSSWKPIVQLSNEIDEKVLPIFSNSKVIDLVVIAFFAGVGEELFFRGWLQNALANNFGIGLGIFITSTIFGLLHYLSREYAVYAFLVGIYLGIIYQVSGNLYIVMAVHALYDFVALLYLVRKNKQMDIIL